VTVKKYTPDYEAQLFSLIESEGADWEYYQEPHKANYIEALQKSETYIVLENNNLVGYARTLNDFVVWVVDLLVHKNCRGKNYGKFLMEHVCVQHPTKDVYVLGGNDVLPYYEKLLYKPDGVVYKIN